MIYLNIPVGFSGSHAVEWLVTMFVAYCLNGITLLSNQAKNKSKIKP